MGCLGSPPYPIYRDELKNKYFSSLLPLIDLFSIHFSHFLSLFCLGQQWDSFSSDGKKYFYLPKVFLAREFPGRRNRERVSVTKFISLHAWHVCVRAGENKTRMKIRKICLPSKAPRGNDLKT